MLGLQWHVSGAYSDMLCRWVVWMLGLQWHVNGAYSDMLCWRGVQDVRAMLLLYSAKKELTVNRMLVDSLQQILAICQQDQQRRAAAARASRSPADDVNVDDSEVKMEEAQDGDATSAGQPQGRDSPTTSKDLSTDPKPSSSAETQADPALPASKDSGEKAKEDSAAPQAEDLAGQDPSKVGSGSAGETQVGDTEEKESEAEADVMCVDVMEASQSVEVCTMPSAEGSGHLTAASPGPLKRRVSGGVDDVEGRQLFFEALSCFFLPLCSVSFFLSVLFLSSSLFLFLSLSLPRSWPLAWPTEV